MSLSPGARLGVYEIVSLLGAGGMGQVYRARDTTLGRDVALKVLPDSVTDDPERIARFRREAQVLAILNHPHIGAIYGFEEAAGHHFLVLELVDGQTLDQRVAGRKPPALNPQSSAGGLEVGEALSIAREIAEALEAAHEKGIIHRDLKPANVALTAGGRVKVLDFGLAKAEALQGSDEGQSDGSKMTMMGTRAGMILGTPAYMSPEQARGQPVDKRTDIWAFGCVLFELLTGCQPFARETVADTLAAILEREPDWRELPDATPAHIRRLLQRCLEKKAGRRLRDIGEARIELEPVRAAHTRAVAGGAIDSDAGCVTVVVLPFQSLSIDAEHEYFGDGLTEETISALGQMNPERIRVIARTSSMAYKRTSKRAAEIGRELRADYLLESSVRREARSVRIAVQLIRAEDETQVWAATYNRTPDSFLGVQDEIGHAIAAQVRARLSPTQSERLAHRPTRDPEAYDLYLRGRSFGHRMAQREALECHQRAVEKDPTYALAHAALAETYASFPIFADASPLEYLERARLAAERALTLDPRLSEGHAAAGWVEFFVGWNWGRAEPSLRRAMELNPNSAMTHFYFAHFLSNSFRHDEAIALIEHARELDPVSPVMRSFHGQFLFDARRYAEALQPIRQAIEIAPDFFHAHEILSRLYIQLGDFDAALDECELSYRLSGGMLFALARKGYLFARTGHGAEAAEVMSSLEQIARERFVAPFHFALLHAGLGNRETALEYLEQSVELHAGPLVLVPTDPIWDDWRSEPRFQALMKKCGFPERERSSGVY